MPALRRARGSLVLLAATVSLVPSLAAADGIVRRQVGNFPIAASVTVPQGAELVYVSGMLPDPVEPAVAGPEGRPARFGDTEAQAESVFRKLAAALEAAGYAPRDVVKMNVYLVGDPAAGGRMDFAGFMRAYGRHYGHAGQPNVPARTTVQVVALPIPGAWVEIEVIAARAAPRP